MNSKMMMNSVFITLLLLQLKDFNSQAFSAPKSKVTKTEKIKKSLDQQQLVSRRKSPALWREDLTLFTDDTNVPTKETPSTLPLPYRPPEVMAPCGGFPQLKAAISNGADSVYLGLSAFSARARASNFSPSELVEAVKLAHASGVKVYVALNVLVFQNELKEVAEWIHVCSNAKVDALIVQDFGVARLAQKIAPHLEIHASTQQTVTNTDGVMYAKERGGASRVVLGRELSLDEIRAVTRDLHALGEKQVEVETFVHGALCVSYSGQCFSSEAWGGRSANRGQCAQACRLPYGLIRNGELVDLQDMSYLLSPQDLCGIDQVEDLVRAGVSCLKIEGRLKDENYVAATTRAYRNAVDDAWDKIMKERGGDGESLASPRSRLLESNVTVSKLELAQLFSRGQDETNDGLTSGFFEGSQHQRLVRGRSPRHRGVHMGRVLEGSSPQNGLFILNDEARGNGLKLGDGIVVDRGMPQEEELGGPIFDIQDMRDGSKRIRFSNVVHKEWKRKDDASRKGFGSRTPLAPPGAHVWKTSDASVEKKMRKLAEAPTPKIPVKVEVSGKVGGPLIVRVCDLTTGAVGIGESEGMLEHGNLKGMDEKAVRKAIGTLGNTSFTLLNNDSSVDLAGLDLKAWCPISWVKKARQQAIDNLTGSNDMTESIENKVLNTELDETKLHDVVASVIGEYSKVQNIVEKKTTSISVLARYQKQVEALCEMIKDGIGIDEIIIDFLEIEGISEAVATVRMLPESTKVLLATPRIIKPGEEGIWKTLLRLEPDGLLIRSAGLLHKLQKLGGYGAEVDVGTGKNVKIPELVGDFSLNAINVVTTRELIDFGGLSRITAGYDLNAKSITELAQIMNGAATQLEVIAHAHLPIFHTEHCVFARFLSKGNSYVDCGHVCTRNNVHLRDQTGKDNLVLADMGCRNTVFSAEAQSGVHSVKEWVDAGVGTLRIELVDEGQNDTKRIVQGYLDVINGKVKPSVVWETLKDIRDSNGRAGGVSHGSLRNNSERRAGEV